jgi:hypothetical protein
MGSMRRSSVKVPGALISAMSSAAPPIEWPTPTNGCDTPAS